MLAGMTGAAMRGLLVAFLVAMPALVLPSSATQFPEMVLLVALLLGGLVCAEYFATSPSFIEFRDARPLNRGRFVFLFICVFATTLVAAHISDPSGLSLLVYSGASDLGYLLDFVCSPVQLIRLMLPPSVEVQTVELVRNAAALGYAISLAAVLFFIVTVRFGQWPLKHGPFNVWINLPLFDPTTGGDVVSRLQRDARLHILGGFLAPFILPALAQMGSETLLVDLLSNLQLFVWCIVGWAMIPAMMIMRGVARLRVAELIAQKRRSFAHNKQFQAA